MGFVGTATNGAENFDENSSGGEVSKEEEYALSRLRDSPLKVNDKKKECQDAERQ